eukprot:CAMPEP_0201531522 /NCGR_PEP_ID=MMETSP0161_2-20130828/47917_1 /ASSEMBLY_ACC=CAM_ASM_000251 /TAXON_ID=180227 /ORGANISM="Neoparamoeba aestuarina, Strain SoJaBio B1-5/56/2" /LENGTH=266 /DNA_ID=CAMNT_0047934483 /DNA_START=16 /DNA_END=813 /DNA_ORIENTATION=+
MSQPVPMTDLSYTQVESRYNCSEAVYYLHITLAYLIILFGILAFISRLVPRLQPYHVWFGRGFLVAMYWEFGTAMLIHNTGLPLAILIFFLFLLIGMSIGWLVIRVHQANMQEEAEKRVDQKLKENKDLLADSSVSELVAEAKTEIADSKTLMQRFFSLKALHGFCMAFAWYQLFGRAFTVNPGDDFSCYTYPAYKRPEDHDDQIYVPLEDDDWEDRSTAGFVSMVTLPAVAVFIVVGFVMSFYYARKGKKTREETQNLPKESVTE